MFINRKQQCSIPGLEGRYFEFLGLYNCPYESYSRENIPAKEVQFDYLSRIHAWHVQSETYHDKSL
jgi:hypothetical protein